MSKHKKHPGYRAKHPKVEPEAVQIAEISTAVAQKPQWWTEPPEASWERVKAEVVEDWHKVKGVGVRLEHKVADGAIAFGHAARRAYRSIKAWGKDLESELESDWRQSTRDGDSTWEKVKGAVKHGWESATTKED